MNVVRAVAVISCALAFSVSAYADNGPLLNIDPALDGSFVEPANNKTWGWSFHVTTPIRATHLAWNDTGRDGLSHSHQVGLWKDPYNSNGGTLLSSVTIPVGTLAELSGPWRRVAIIPIELQVGDYSIGGQNNALSLDKMVYKQLDYPDSIHPAGLDMRVSPSSFIFNTDGQDGFYAPGTHGSSWYAYWGAELGVNLFVGSVPEPSTRILFLLVVGALASSSIYRLASRKGRWD
jgi:hypothetical protein